MVVNWSENLVQYETKPPRVFHDGDDAYEEELSQSMDGLLGGDESIPTMEEDVYFDALENPNLYFESNIP